MDSKVTDKIMYKCTRCKKKVQHLAVTQYPQTLYTICFDCLIELDINHRDYSKYEKNKT
jgi:DNA-directed RNA polymerase subunit RPC12/RpoP